MDNGTSDLQQESISKQLLTVNIPVKKFYYKSITKSSQLKVCMLNCPGVREFTCEICKECFSSSSDLRQHMCKHTDETEWPYECEICGQKFAASADLHVHKCCHLSLQCTVCKQQFLQLVDLKQHVSHSHKGLSEVVRSLTCEGCKQRFGSLLDFQRHRKEQVHNFTERPNFCLFCEKQFSCRDDIEMHTCNRAYTCTLCNQTFINSYELKNHMHVHRHDEIVTCKACNKQFKFLYSAIRHMHVHNGTQLFSCDVCGEKFRRVDSLKLHRSCHSSEEQFTCNICQEKYTSVYTLIQHKLSHCDEVPYCCDYCSNKFSDKHQLEVHMYSHTEEKSYTCIICKESFINRCELKSHMRVHRCKETCSCHVCKKEFKHRSNLVRHVRDRHTGTRSFLSLGGQKQFICDVCGKQFLILTKFESHRRIHFDKEEDVSKTQILDSHQPVSLTLLANQLTSRDSIQQKIVSSVDENQTLDSHQGTQEQIASGDYKYHSLASKHQCKSRRRDQQQITVSKKQILGSYRLISNERLTCSVCSASFESFNELDTHLHVHRHVEAFMCNVCYKKIMRCSNFIRHMRMHFTKHEIVCNIGEEQTICSQESNCKQIASGVCKNQSLGSKHSHKSHAGVQQQISNTVSDSPTLDSYHLMSNDNSSLTCSVCSATFVNFSELDAHLRIHRHVERFKCNVCCKQIMRCNNFIRHMRMHFSKHQIVSSVNEDQSICLQESNQQQNSISICTEQTTGSTHDRKSYLQTQQQSSSAVSDSQALDLHPLVADNDNTHTCTVCGATFVNFDELDAHLHVHKHVETFTCNVCNKQIMRRNNFVRHLRMHIGKQLFSCGVCGKTSYRSDLISSHMLSHSAQQQSACGTSNENVTSSSAVEEQEFFSKDQELFSCDLSRKPFSHLAAFEADKCDNFDTQQANNLTKQPTLFSGNRTSNKGNQPQVTTAVGESQTPGLQRVISNKNMYTCSICSKKFIKFPELEAHLHVHRHHEVFACNVCTKQIRHCSNFIRHMRIHFCTPPFCCGICGVRSHHGYDIKKHMQIHTGDRSFSCNDCGKKFTRESNLRVHKLSHRHKHNV